MFLKTLPAGIVTSLNTKLTSIETALKQLLANAQNETTVTPAGDAPAISNEYLASYKTVMEQFNDALSITAKELLDFKTKIIYQQGDIINGNNDKMNELFSDSNSSFSDKLNTIINSLNNLVETQKNLNPLDQTEIVSSVNTVISNISITNKYLDNLLSVNTETNSLIKTNSNNTKKENELIRLEDILSEATGKSVEIPPTNVYYNVPGGASEREQLADIFDYVHNYIDTVNGEESPIGEDDELTERTNKLIIVTTQKNSSIIKAIFDTRSDTLLSEFKNSFDKFTENNNLLLSKISDSINNSNTKSTFTELTKELKSLNSQLVTINADGIFIKPDSINDSEGTIEYKISDDETDLTQTESDELPPQDKHDVSTSSIINFGSLIGGMHTAIRLLVSRNY
jgi:hypothetical protein